MSRASHLLSHRHRTTMREKLEFYILLDTSFSAIFKSSLGKDICPDNCLSFTHHNKQLHRSSWYWRWSRYQFWMITLQFRRHHRQVSILNFGLFFLKERNHGSVPHWGILLASGSYPCTQYVKIQRGASLLISTYFKGRWSTRHTILLLSLTWSLFYIPHRGKLQQNTNCP